jgi:hypothetical protein
MPGTWTANNNGFLGVIVVASQDPNGNIAGTAFGNPMKGFYSSTTNKVRFWRAVAGSNVNGTGSTVATADQIQIYTGYLYGCSGALCMAGTFESFAGTGATALKPDYGWNARKN